MAYRAPPCFSLNSLQQRDLLFVIACLERQPERLNEYAVSFLAGCKERILTHATLSEKQFALLERMATPVELAEDDAAALSEVMEYFEFLPPPVSAQFADIVAWTKAPGASLTEKQRAWVLQVRDLLRFVGELVGCKTHIVDADRLLQKVLAQALSVPELLSIQEQETLQLLADKLAERGAFSLFKSELRTLTALWSKIQTRQAGLTDKYYENCARRAAGLEALSKLEAATGLTVTVRNFVKSCIKLHEKNGHLSLKLSNSLVKMAASHGL